MIIRVILVKLEVGKLSAFKRSKVIFLVVCQSAGICVKHQEVRRGVVDVCGVLDGNFSKWLPGGLGDGF